MANTPSPAHSPTEETEFFGGDIVIVDYISLINDGIKTSSKTSGIFPAGSKIERAFSITRPVGRRARSYLARVRVAKL